MQLQGHSGGGEGAEVVYPLRSTPTLANNILNEIGARGQIKRKVYQRVLPENPNRDYYYIMRETPNTTALLIEYGFIDNPRDAFKLQNNLNNYAEGVVKAVSEYIGVPYVQPGATEIGDTYTVQRGDTLYSIANRYNITVNELKNVNNLTSDNLAVGQILNLPMKQEQNEYITYVVQNGDSLYSIANKYNVGIAELIDYNALPTTVLSVGETIKIPTENVKLNENTYIVKRGDTLYRIANLYNIPVNDLINANNLDSNILTIGQELIIPIKPSSEEDYVVYEVQKGDTLYSIARKYNAKVNSIKAYNNLNSDTLFVGQVLQIPTDTTETVYQTYQIAPGDTLYSIARKYNTTVSAIKAINNNLTNLLSIGQIIKIPQ